MQENEHNNPYVRRPGSVSGDGADERRLEAGMPNSMAKAASTMGVLAVVSLFTMLIYPALILGATAIVLALLSRDREGRMHDKAKSAITTGVVAIVADAAVIIFAMTLLISNGSFKQQINDSFKQTYGQTFDDMWEDAMDGRLDLDYTLGNL